MTEQQETGAKSPGANGPLAGLKIIEMAGIGPVPFCAMLLADLGAEVIRIDRKGTEDSLTTLAVLKRGRRSVALDLKRRSAADALLHLVERADALIEGFRPGVMERLGLGPQECHARNPRLVYGRMTGWGQDGPLAMTAGHDLNFIALTGALAAIGTAAEPVPPLNLVGDFAGGALYLAIGVLAAVFEARRSGHGQVVDAAMVDGAASLMTAFYGLAACGAWKNERGTNFLDGGAPFYRVYRCADRKWLAVAAVEPQFYAALLDRLGLRQIDAGRQWERDDWPALHALLSRTFALKGRDAWAAHFEGSDACVAPVLDMTEAPHHLHNRARQSFVEIEGVVQPAPAPRFSRTKLGPPKPPRAPGEDTQEVLEAWGVPIETIGELRRSGAI